MVYEASGIYADSKLTIGGEQNINVLVNIITRDSDMDTVAAGISFADSEIKAAGSIEIYCDGTQDINYCINDTLKCNRLEGKPLPSFYMENRTGEPCNYHADKDPVNFFYDSFVEYTEKGVDTWFSADRDVYWKNKTISVDEVRRAFPGFSKSEELPTRFSGETFTEYISWIQPNYGGPMVTLTSRDEIKKGSRMVVKIVPKAGYTTNGIPINGYSIDFADVKNIGNDRRFEAFFHGAVDSTERLTVGISSDKENARHGEYITFTVQAQGEKSELQYDWYLYKSFGWERKRVDFPSHYEYEDNGNVLRLRVDGTDTDVVGVQCVVKTISSSVVTDYCRYTVEKPTGPVIDKQPESIYICEGSSAVFEIEAYGDYDYQWGYCEGDNIASGDAFYNGEMFDCYISGSSSKSLVIDYVYTDTFPEDFNVFCVVTDSVGRKVMSDFAFVSVRTSPYLLEDLNDVHAVSGGSAVLKLNAIGVDNNKDMTYEWYYVYTRTNTVGLIGDISVAGKDKITVDGNTLTFGVVTPEIANNYEFYCVVRDANGIPLKSRVVGIVLDNPNPMLLLGNVNGDGLDTKPTVNDARTILRAAIHIETLTGLKAFLADVDENGEITVGDARIVLRMAIDMEALAHSNKY